MIKKLIKYSAVAFAILMAILVIAGIVLKIKYPPEKLKGMVLDMAKSKLNREVELDSVSIGIIKGVFLKGFKISEKPDFKTGTFAQIGQAELHVSYLPLIIGHIVIDKVVIQGASATVIRMSDGKTFNFSDLLTGAPETEAKKPKPEETKPAAPINLLVNRVIIKDNSFTFDDRSPSKIQAKLSNINLDIKGVSLVSPFSINLGLNAQTKLAGKDISAAISYKGKFNIAGAGSLWIDKLEIASKGLKINVNGTADNVTGDVAFKLKIGSSLILPEGIASIVQLPKDAGLSGAVNTNISLDGTLNNINSHGTIDAGGVDVKYQDIFHKPAGSNIKINFDTALKNMGESVVIKNLETEIGQSVIALNGNIFGAASGKPNLNIKGSLTKMQLEELMAYVPQYAKAVSGALSGDFSVTGTMPDFKAKGVIDLVNANIKPMSGIELTGTKSHIELTENSFTMTKFESSFNGSPLTVQLDVRNFKAPQINLNGHLNTLDVGKLLAAFTGTGSNTASKPLPPPVPPSAAKSSFTAKAKGKFEIGKVTHTYYNGEKVRFDWDMSGLSADIKAISGTASFSMGKGVMHDLPLLSNLAKKVYPQLQEFSYSSILTNLKLGNGQARIDPAAIHGTQMDISAQGTYDIETGGLDFNVQPKIPKEKLGPDVAKYIKTSEGAVPIELELKGTVSDPKYNISEKWLEKQLKSAVKEKIAEQKEEIKNKIEEKKEQAVDQLKEKTADQIKKSFKNIFKH